MAEEKFIIPQKHHLGQADRNQHKGHRSMVIWFTGLSGSGKSTLANLLEQSLFGQGCHTYILDGDNVRAGLNADLGFGEEDRRENIRRIGEVARLMTDAGLIVLTAFISPYREDRARVRALFPEGQFVEVFVDCPIEVCEARDVKGLYQKARAGIIKNFTGIDAPFETPDQPEIHLKSHTQSPEAAVAQLMAYLKPALALG
ncbi:MAG: adenylyl-sulfate kinase [Microscillaceae bacterium]